MAEEKETYDHPLYKHCEEKDADAIAWAFVNSKKMVRFPFKFPELGPDEIRANVLYTGLCHSDVLTVRSLWGPAPYPIAPGHEMVCEVSQVGANVKDFKKGDLVGFGTQRDSCDKCKWCLNGQEEVWSSNSRKRYLWKILRRICNFFTTTCKILFPFTRKFRS